MTAPTRIVHAGYRTYALDPYVRDTAGRFAPKPAETPAPVQLLEDTAAAVECRDLTQGTMGAWTTGADPSCCWRVRVIREEDGSHRVVYLEPQA